MGQQMVGGDDIEHGELLDPIRMIQRQPMPDTATAVMAGDPVAAEAQALHYLDLVLSHGSEGVGRMVLATIGFTAVAIAPQVRCYNGIFPG